MGGETNFHPSYNGNILVNAMTVGLADKDKIFYSAAAGIGKHLDHVLSVEEVGVFKPHPSVYQLAVDRLGVPAAAIAFQSSNGWDAHAASAFGMRVVWCNRDGRPPERLPGAPDHVVASLAELPGLLSG